jgi:hypothetical protein
MSGIKTNAIAVAVLGLLSATVSSQQRASAIPAYSSDGGLKSPEHYREWIYLSTGFDMSYRPAMKMGHHMFDNVFVDPDSYRVFLDTGTWPDRTMLVLEGRGARDRGSINRTGNYQDGEIMSLEVHLKDEKRFPGGWAFFAFDGAPVGKLVPHTADCYSCHAAHGAVDTTFVQFYPTLLPIATGKKTLARSYVAGQDAAK